MSIKKSKSQSLSEKIAESFEPRPLKDPEIDSEDETVAKLVEVGEDDGDFGFSSSSNALLSDIRKQNVKPLSDYSDKYHGKVSSRKELEESDQSTDEEVDSDDGGNQNEDDDLEEYRKRLKNYQIDSEPDEFLGTDEESEGEQNQADSESNEEDDSDYDSSASAEDQSDIENDESAEYLRDKNQIADIEKGLSVQNQLKIWEKLLEVRIHSQKLLINANSLPLTDVFSKFCEENEDFLKLAQEAQQNVTGLLEKMMEMQQLLMKQYPETKSLAINSSSSLPAAAMKRKTSNENDNETPTKRFASELNENFENFRPYRNSVLQKWHDRTKILTPGAGGGSKGKDKSNNFDIVKKIEGVLFNKNDLIKKSQIVKGNYKIFGQKKSTTTTKTAETSETNDHQKEDEEGRNENVEETTTTNICREIYDDTDFYHQQLRELIEFKTNTLTNPAEMSKQFAELQKLRHKMKKKVDTRASKGRKIRYIVHNKLVNFMAPNDNSTWTDESKNELYRSLFAT